MTAVPSPHEPLSEQQDEDEHGHEGADGQSSEGDGEGQEEEHLDVENQKQNRVEIVMGLELNPESNRQKILTLHPYFGCYLSLCNPNPQRHIDEIGKTE